MLEGHNMTYRAEVDGLRAIAVTLVILFHAGVEQFAGGFIGVDVFFVISGYLITTIVINDLENQKFSLGWKQRCFQSFLLHKPSHYHQR